MDFNLNWIYTAISWVLLRWHDVWEAVIPEDSRPLDTDWQWVLAIVFLVVTIRIILFPLFIKQIKSQRAMQTLQPKIKELQQRYKGDREAMQREMMELYRTEKANPLMGCLPLLLQAPVFIGLLHVLRRITPGNVFEPNWTLYTWTKEQWFSALHSKVFGAPIWGTFNTDAAQLEGVSSSLNVRIVCGILVILMTVTTYFTSRQMILKTGWSEEPQQRMMQRIMLYGIPFMLLFSGVIFPVGVIMYWVVNNAFSLGQQQWVLRKYPPPKTGSVESAVKITAKPGTKKYDEQLREKQERAKASAPKPGAKPKKEKSGSAAAQLKAKQEQAKTKASQADKPGAKSNKKKGGATRGANK